MPSPPFRVAIIGSGASGIAAVKTCLESGLEPVCFERDAHSGGLWRYTDSPVEGQGCVMKSTVINTSKEMMSYSDYPIPAQYPIYMHNTHVYEYFQQYMKEFGIEKHIRYNTEIIIIKKADNFKETGEWEVRSRDRTTGEEKFEIFQGVLSCSGHHAEMHKPEFPGLKEFQGDVTHSHDYRTPEGYRDKRVLIIGIGNSGGDIAVELSRLSKQVYLSTRRGTWLLRRVGPAGYPGDMNFLTRPIKFMNETFPTLMSKVAEKAASKAIDHELYSLKPNYSTMSQHPMVNDDMPNRIICGSIKIKADIKRFTSNGVEFVDGTSEENIDRVVLATGYSFGFPYIDKEVIDVKENRVQLFKYMFPPDLEHPTLAVIGCIQPLGSIMPISEMQCRVAVEVFKKKARLPSRGEMWDDIRNKEAKMSKRYVKSRRHTIQVDYIPFMDELAEIIGCKPDYVKLMTSDPKLAYHVMCGPVTPYQYRLTGPHSWSGARKAILTQWQRTEAPLRSRPLDKNGSSNMHFMKMAAIFLVVYFLLRFLFF